MGHSRSLSTGTRPHLFLSMREQCGSWSQILSIIESIPNAIQYLHSIKHGRNISRMMVAVALQPVVGSSGGASSAVNVNDAHGHCRVSIFKLFLVGVDIVSTAHHGQHQQTDQSSQDTDDRVQFGCLLIQFLLGHGVSVVEVAATALTVGVDIVS